MITVRNEWEIPLRWEFTCALIVHWHAHTRTNHTGKRHKNHAVKMCLDAITPSGGAATAAYMKWNSRK